MQKKLSVLSLSCLSFAPLLVSCAKVVSDSATNANFTGNTLQKDVLPRLDAAAAESFDLALKEFYPAKGMPSRDDSVTLVNNSSFPGHARVRWHQTESKLEFSYDFDSSKMLRPTLSTTV